MPWGGNDAGTWTRELTTLSELLVQAGNQRAAQLLSLAQGTDETTSIPGGQDRDVVLRVRPIFLDLFRPADPAGHRRPDGQAGAPQPPP
jgi:hypothetical protein